MRHATRVLLLLALVASCGEDESGSQANSDTGSALSDVSEHGADVDPGDGVAADVATGDGDGVAADAAEGDGDTAAADAAEGDGDTAAADAAEGDGDTAAADAVEDGGDTGPQAGCGNGIIEANADEDCDDGQPPADSDGCDANCRVEHGWTCVDAPSVCTPPEFLGAWHRGVNTIELGEPMGAGETRWFRVYVPYAAHLRGTVHTTGPVTMTLSRTASLVDQETEELGGDGAKTFKLVVRNPDHYIVAVTATNGGTTGHIDIPLIPKARVDFGFGKVVAGATTQTKLEFRRLTSIWPPGLLDTTATTMEFQVEGEGVLTAADFNGDGFDDLAVMPIATPSEAFQVYLNDPGSGQLLQEPLEFGYAVLDQSSVSPFLPQEGQYTLGDVNGDGLADLVRMDTSYPGTQHPEGLFWTAWLNNGDGTIGPAEYLSFYEDLPIDFGVMHQPIMGDFNGDGTDDFCTSLTYWAGGNQRFIVWYHDPATGETNLGLNFLRPEVVGSKFWGAAGDIWGDGYDTWITLIDLSSGFRYEALSNYPMLPKSLWLDMLSVFSPALGVGEDHAMVGTFEGPRCGPEGCDGPKCHAPDGQCATLVINEVDYLPASEDGNQFVEVFNVGLLPADLSQYSLEYIIGTTGAVVWAAAFDQAEQTVLESKGYLVFAKTALLDSLPTEVVGLSAPEAGLFQDLGPGVLRLVKSGDVVDTVAWGTTVPGVGEGAAAPADEGEGSLSRFPDGSDTGRNSTDFWPVQATPGGPNDGPVANRVKLRHWSSGKYLTVLFADGFQSYPKHVGTGGYPVGMLPVSKLFLDSFWAIEPRANGQVAIRNTRTGLYLQEGRDAQGKSYLLVTDEIDEFVHWRLAPDIDGRVRLTSVLTGNAINLPAGLPVVTTGGDTWVLEPVGGTCRDGEMSGFELLPDCGGPCEGCAEAPSVILEAHIMDKWCRLQVAAAGPLGTGLAVEEGQYAAKWVCDDTPTDGVAMFDGRQVFVRVGETECGLRWGSAAAPPFSELLTEGQMVAKFDCTGEEAGSTVWQAWADEPTYPSVGALESFGLQARLDTDFCVLADTQGPPGASVEALGVDSSSGESLVLWDCGTEVGREVRFVAAE